VPCGNINRTKRKNIKNGNDLEVLFNNGAFKVKKGDGSIFSLKKELPLQHVAHRLSFHSPLISQNK